MLSYYISSLLYIIHLSSLTHPIHPPPLISSAKNTLLLLIPSVTSYHINPLQQVSRFDVYKSICIVILHNPLTPNSQRRKQQRNETKRNSQKKPQHQRRNSTIITVCISLPEIAFTEGDLVDEMLNSAGSGRRSMRL